MSHLEQASQHPHDPGKQLSLTMQKPSLHIK